MFIKSNVGLGHREFVFLMALKSGKHLILNSIGDYKAGTIIVVDQYWKSDIARVTTDEAQAACDLEWDVVQYIINVDREVPQYVVKFIESDAGSGEVWYRGYDTEEAAMNEVHETNKYLIEKITPVCYIKAEYLGLRDKIPEGHKF